LATNLQGQYREELSQLKQNCEKIQPSPLVATT